MKATVLVRLKTEVLDAQGDAVRRALGKLGFEGVKDVRVGKIIEIEIDEAHAKAPDLKQRLAEDGRRDAREPRHRGLRGPRLTGAAGEGALRFSRAGERTVVHTARAESPLKLLLPRNHGAGSWVYVATLGGGLVDGDAVALSRRGRPRHVGPAGHAGVDEGVPLAARDVAAPARARGVGGDPRGAARSGHVLRGGALRAARRRRAGGRGRVARPVDALTSGRAARGERWAFARYASRTRVTRAGRAPRRRRHPARPRARRARAADGPVRRVRHRRRRRSPRLRGADPPPRRRVDPALAPRRATCCRRARSATTAPWAACAATSAREAIATLRAPRRTRGPGARRRPVRPPVVASDVTRHAPHAPRARQARPPRRRLPRAEAPRARPAAQLPGGRRAPRDAAPRARSATASASPSSWTSAGASSAGAQVMAGVAEMIARGAGRGHVPRRHEARHGAPPDRARRGRPRARPLREFLPVPDAEPLPRGRGPTPTRRPGESIVVARRRSSSTPDARRVGARRDEHAATGPSRSAATIPFDETNRALDFDRARPRGMRLDIPAGTAVRFEPGETKTRAPLVPAERGRCPRDRCESRR